MNEATWLPLVFILLTGISVLVYAILDGYDLGVGILLPVSNESKAQKDKMIASIGPFWDANETWLVLAVGLLLIAFPQAHNIILYELYLPAAIMLICLILRGVAFDFRAKAITNQRENWDRIFKLGSIGTALSQGYMLGRYVLGFEDSTIAFLFAWVSAFCVASAYAFIGGAWLVMKSEGPLQIKAYKWTRVSAWFAALGIFLVSVINPIASERILNRWLNFPEIFLLFPIPLILIMLFLINDRYLSRAPYKNDFGCWIPFASATIIFFLCFQGLAYSFFPYVIPEKLTIWEAASAEESLLFIFYGAIFVVPAIIGYTLFSYRIFWGKTKDLQYY